MKNIDEMDITEMKNWVKGYLLLAIGEGTLDSAVYTVIQTLLGSGARRQAELTQKLKENSRIGR